MTVALVWTFQILLDFLCIHLFSVMHLSFVDFYTQTAPAQVPDLGQFAVSNGYGLNMEPPSKYLKSELICVRILRLLLLKERKPMYFFLDSLVFKLVWQVSYASFVLLQVSYGGQYRVNGMQVSISMQVSCIQ